MADRERIRQLMMALIDDEITEEENTELQMALADSLELRRELQEMEQFTRSISTIKIKDPADDVLAEFEKSITRQVAMPLGWLLLIGGITLFMGWWGITWIMDPGHSPVIRFAGVVIFLGFLLIFLAKVKERLLERRHDPYRQIIR
ncbi:MAG: hypothetical protein GY835_08480 [bacterium]|nr:hypothetical protein [bacterium]